MSANGNLTSRLREYAYDLGADLVGIASIDRFRGAPIMMSPKGIMPTAKFVVVLGIHHPDAAIQMGGEPHPQDLGPYKIQYAMNTKMDYMAYRIANFLDDAGFDAIPIASSNIWRYREMEGLNACFAPDMSHIYAATCAGLGEIGWNGLTTTPEYGAWNRFISIITDAPLEHTPMYDGEKLCDRCGECIRHCPTDAYRKEVNGTKEISPDDEHTYKFANKNLWRCAWGEHFDLDLDLPIPEKVDEQVLLDYVAKYGKRGGEMGCCVKYCLPPFLRSPGGDFTSTYMRKKHSVADLSLPVHRRIYDTVADLVRRYGVEDVVFLDEQAVDALGGKKVFGPARGAVVYAIRTETPDGDRTREELYVSHTDGVNPDGTGVFAESTTLWQFNIFANLDISRTLDNAGFRSMCRTGVNDRAYAEAAGIVTAAADDAHVRESFGVVLTNAPFVSTRRTGLQDACCNPRKSLSQNVRDLLREEGSDQIAIVPAARIDGLAAQLQAGRGEERILRAHDKNSIHAVCDPLTSETTRTALRPSDHLTGAKSVILIGLHFPEIVTRRTIKPPAYAAGPYLYAMYETSYEMGYTAHKLCRYLNSLGYKAVRTFDLTGMGGNIGSPRGELPDAFCNSLEAAEAGLGTLAANGVCYTGAHGFSQRFVAVVTDAPMDELLDAAPAPDLTSACKDCGACSAACPAKAFTGEGIALTVNGKPAVWHKIDWSRCDWAKRFALCGEEGSKYTSSKTDVPLPEKVTPENLAAAMREADPVLKHRPTTTQRCIIDCPLVQGK